MNTTEQLRFTCYFFSKTLTRYTKLFLNCFWSSVPEFMGENHPQPNLLSSEGQNVHNSPCWLPSDLDPRYYRLCDKKAAWGIVLEALAGVGAVASVAFMTLCWPSSASRTQQAQTAPTQFLFLLGAVASALPSPSSSHSTAASSTRFFLFGVLAPAFLLPAGSRLQPDEAGAREAAALHAGDAAWPWASVWCRTSLPPSMWSSP